MTSASELFYKRRSDTRPDRTAGSASTCDLRLELNYSINRHHTCRHDKLDGCDHPLQHLHNYRGSRPCPDTLPSSVVQARERLVERLGGVPISISSNRRSSRAPFIMARVEYNLDRHSAEVSNQVSQTDIYRTANQKKPPGLSQDAVDLLCSQVKCNNVSRDKGGKTSSSSCSCSICLESLKEGDDEVIWLACTHRFHSTCLTPWIRTCGDCPYCRQPIITT